MLIRLVTSLCFCWALFCGSLSISAAAELKTVVGDSNPPRLSEQQRANIKRIVATLCHSETLVSADFANPVSLEITDFVVRGQAMGKSYELVQGDSLYRVQRLAPSGQLRRISIDVVQTQASEQTLAAVFANADCTVQGGRIRHPSQQSVPDYVYVLASELLATGAPIAINPTFDSSIQPLAGPAATVRVAVIDSGVDYSLVSVAERLARDQQGGLLGYDYWDMDDRPFDSHPRAHPFFVQRHGTRTLSIIADEAPIAELVPYRYPRPEMSRLQALIEHADNAGVRIVNLSMGSRNAEDWDRYYAAAQAHPDMLFVVSAGNDGIDIDVSAVWPAAFDLPNQITVTSALDSGQLAERVNYGAIAVDLMVPAEDMIATEYAGRVRLVSGSSYAASRISALAACLAGAHTAWNAQQLRAAVFGFATPPTGNAQGKVAVGFIDDPVLYDRGACKADPLAPGIERTEQITFLEDPQSYTALAVTVAMNRDSDWRRDSVMAAVERARTIFQRCEVNLNQVALVEFTGGLQHRYFDQRSAAAVMALLPTTRPAIVFLQRSLQETEYGAQAYGRANARRAWWLRDSVWMMADVEHPGVALAHELFHVFADSGVHSDEEGNLMRDRTSADGDQMTATQCWQLRSGIASRVNPD